MFKIAIFLSILIISSLANFPTREQLQKYKNQFDYINEKRKQEQQTNADIDYKQFDNTCKKITDFYTSELAIKNQMFSGYLRVFNDASTDHSALYYVFVGADNTPMNELHTKKLIIWLNGGPGSSSLGGLFMENGPLGLEEITDPQTKKKYYKETKRKIHWSLKYNVLFIDQPIGTGNSFLQSELDLPKNTTTEISNQFYQAMLNLKKLKKDCPFFSSYFADQEVYITGESYAGKYVPCFASKILKENVVRPNEKFNLKGIAFGDGFTHPVQLVSQIGAFAYDLGLIDFEERAYTERNLVALNMASHRATKHQLTYYETKNEEDLKQANYLWDLCQQIANDIFDYVITKAGNVDVYNIFNYMERIPFEWVDEYFNYFDENTKNYPNKIKFNVPQEIVFGQYSGAVYNSMSVDFMQPVLPALLDCINQKNFKVLVYQGQNDLIVTSPGTLRWLDSLTWKGSDEFLKQDFKLVKTDDPTKPSGYIKQYKDKAEGRTITYRSINNAGHMVPTDQPENAIQMLDDFINDAYPPIVN